MLDKETFAIAALACAGALAVLAFLVFPRKRVEITLAVFSVVVAGLLMELPIRRFYPQINESGKMFEPDAELGWRFIPNWRGAYVSLGEAHNHVDINAWGFRDDPPPGKNDPRRRILVLGDSFTSNVAVRDEEVFTEIMERRIPDTAVLNFGVNGYGQVQQLLLLEQWLERVQPELVLQMVYLRNDFDDNTGGDWFYPRPHAVWNEESGALELRGPARPEPGQVTAGSFWSFYRDLHLYWLARRGGAMLARRVGLVEPSLDEPSADTPPEFYLCRRSRSEATAERHRMLEALLLRTARVLERRGIPLVVALAPSIVQVEADRWLATLDAYGERAELFDLTLPNRSLLDFARANGLHMVDLLPPLRAGTESGQQLYNPMEQHWNAEGNRVVAESLLEFLAVKSFVLPSPRGA